jgi:hypothetical protein
MEDKYMYYEKNVKRTPLDITIKEAWYESIDKKFNTYSKYLLNTEELYIHLYNIMCDIILNDGINKLKCKISELDDDVNLFYTKFNLDISLNKLYTSLMEKYKKLNIVFKPKSNKWLSKCFYSLNKKKEIQLEPAFGAVFSLAVSDVLSAFKLNCNQYTLVISTDHIEKILDVIFEIEISLGMNGKYIEDVYFRHLV